VGKVRQGKSAINGALQATNVAQAGIKPQRRPKPATWVFRTNVTADFGIVTGNFGPS
jgi:hypothetical protein